MGWPHGILSRPFKELKNIQNGVLGDIAPTILQLMGVPQPEAMTCHSLL
jgi:2,3-bisphosphoglycerate-independent phosphoglycerate mutase